MIIYHLYLLSEEGRVYDFYDSFVVVANSAREARTLAAATLGAEDEWLDRTKTACLKLGNGPKRLPAGVVVGSFNAG